MTLQHKFVQLIPESEDIEDGVLYISIEYATAVHKCFCGCGREVVTPFTPTDWRLTFDGKTVSLNPSIGNWSFPCRSHYVIKRNEVIWAGSWTEEQVILGKERDQRSKVAYFSKKNGESQKERPEKQQPQGPWNWLRNLFR